MGFICDLVVVDILLKPVCACVRWQVGWGMAADLGPGPAKRSRVEEARGERAVLLTSLKKLSDAIDKTVEEAREEYGSLGVEEFVSAPGGRGIRRMWAHVGSYVECLRANGVNKYSELEGLWRQHYDHSEVREAVDELLESEDNSHQFIDDVEKRFKELDVGRRVASKMVVGETLPGTLKLVDARSGEEEVLEHCWKGSKVTLLVLLRHFG